MRCSHFQHFTPSRCCPCLASISTLRFLSFFHFPMHTYSARMDVALLVAIASDLRSVAVPWNVVVVAHIARTSAVPISQLLDASFPHTFIIITSSSNHIPSPSHVYCNTSVPVHFYQQRNAYIGVTFTIASHPEYARDIASVCAPSLAPEKPTYHRNVHHPAHHKYYTAPHLPPRQ